MNSQQRAADLHSGVPSDHYSRSIENSILHRFWHTTRFKQIGKIVEPTGGKILDIGSADGTFTKVIFDKSKADKITGIDVLKSSVDYAKKRYKANKKFSFIIADAHKLPFKDNEFNAVFCLETLEHVENPSKVVSEMHRVLKPGGYAVVLVPNENILFRVGWGIWLLGPGKIWKDTHIQDLSSDEILNVLKNGGFRIKEVKKFILDMLQAVKVVK